MTPAFVVGVTTDDELTGGDAHHPNALMDYTTNGIDMLALSNRLEQLTGFYLQTNGFNWQIRNWLGNLVIEWGAGTISQNAAACVSYLAERGIELEVA